MQFRDATLFKVYSKFVLKSISIYQTFNIYNEISTVDFRHHFIRPNAPSKRKLNSKNPKYWDKSLLNEEEIIKRVLINNNDKVKVSAIWYKKK